MSIQASRKTIVSGFALAFHLTVQGLGADEICLHANPAIDDVGILPRYSVIEDLDGDGDRDMAIEDQTFIILLINDGAGRLTELPPIELYTEVYGIAGADFDLDGDMDLVVSLGIQDKIGILLNHGDATFAQVEKYLTCSIPLGVAVGDVNGDFAPDVASACGTYPGQVGVNINNGDGTFSSAVAHSTDGDRASFVALLDMHKDGDLDLAITNEQSDTVAVYINKGEGEFTGPALVDVPDHPSTVTAVELGGNGGEDLVVSCGVPFEETGILAVLMNQGAGFAPFVEYGYPDNGQLAAAGDLDGDGDLDLLGSYGGYGAGDRMGMIVWQNDGGGKLSKRTDIPLPSMPYYVGCADMNGDRRIDGVAVSDSGTIQVFPNQGSGQFIEPRVLKHVFDHFVLADLNQDGHEDMIVENTNAKSVDSILVRINNGDGTFGAIREYPTLFGATHPVAADLDSDGDLDLVVRCGGRYNPIGQKLWYSGIVTFLNAGDGTLDDGTEWLTGDDVSIFDMAVGDFDADGYPDIIASQGSPEDILHLLQNDQNGGFHDTLLTPPFLPNPMNTLDLNGDGKPELILNRGSPDDNLNDVYEWTDEGQFEWRSTITTSVEDAFTIRSADFDGDGIVDLLIRADHYWDTELLTLHGLGGFEFGAEALIETPDTPDSIIIDQLNGDCYPDMVTANDGGGSILLYANDGIGGFPEEPMTVMIGSSVGDIALIDSNKDHVKEIYVGFESTHIMILKSCETDIPVSCGPCDGDANGDGVIDPLDSGYVLSRLGCAVNSGDADCDAADVNEDGIVDPLDAGDVLSRFGECD